LPLREFPAWNKLHWIASAAFHVLYFPNLRSSVRAGARVAIAGAGTSWRERSPGNHTDQVAADAGVRTNGYFPDTAGDCRLLIGSLRNLQNVPTGMETENVVAETISLGNYRYPERAAAISLFYRIGNTAAATSGSNGCGMSDTLPPSGSMRATVFASIEIPGHERFEKGTGGNGRLRAVTPDYFHALSIAILRGRGFWKKTGCQRRIRLFLSETLSKMLFANEEPIGKQMRFGSQEGTWRTIVGIAADVKNNGLATHADPEFYLP